MTEYGVNVPDELLKQVEEENIVLFLGAGISKNAPSKLPDFEKLTKDICQEAGVPFSKKLSLDYNLSKVLKSGYDVHGQVLEKINPPHSKPNEWHKTLLRFFGKEGKVRIVTTNFDLHLTVAAEEMKERVPEYIAPAVPLGDDFQGIVYLHGRVDNKGSIVVTGEDFAKAYLNYAWAARFLQAMFAKYTVLFIGYSNGDPLVNYLTRGLSVCANKHYVFVGEDDFRKWNELDITPIVFAQTGNEKYKAMLHVAKDIAEQYCMSELEHEARMREILTTKNEELLAPHEQDYLLRCLSKVNRRSHFCRYAEGKRWFQWAIKNVQEVQALFEPLVQIEEPSRDYSSWIVSTCFENANELLLQELSKRRINHVLWFDIISTIHYRTPDLSRERFTVWIYMLIREIALPAQWKVLHDILVGGIIPPSSNLAWFIFSQILKPTLYFNQNIYDRDSKERPVIASIIIRSDEPKELCDYWKKVLRKRLPEIYGQVHSQITLYLTEAYYMLREQGGWSAELDEVSYGREKIIKIINETEHSFARPMDPLIDVAVDLIQWYADYHSAQLESLIIDWAVSEVPMLQRLSLYAVSLANWDGNRKCKWLCQKHILQWKFFYKEPYQMVGEFFCDLSSALQVEVLANLLQLMHDDPDNENLNYNRALRTHYLLKNVEKQYNIDDISLGIAIKTIEKLLENAGVEYQIDEERKEDIAIDIPSLLDGEFPAALSWYEEVAHSEDFLSEDNKEKFELAFREKAIKEVEWAISIADSLWKQDDEQVFYLSRILLGILGEAELTYKQQMLLLKKIRSIVALDHLGNAVVAFLKNRTEKELVGQKAEAVDELLNCFDYALTWAGEVPFKKDPARCWTEGVINHPIRDILIGLLQTLSNQGNNGKYVIAVTKRLTSLLDSDSEIAQIAEVICASQVKFLVATVPDWTVNKVIPLFDWGNSIEKAERAWDGFLFGGRFSRKLIAPMLRHLIASVDFIGRIDENRYCEFLAWLSMSRLIEKPLEGNSLKTVILKLNETQRETYFSHIRLGEIRDKDYSQWVWSNVLQPLLKMRSLMTQKLTSGELVAVLRWIIEAPEYSERLIEKITNLSPGKLKDCYQLNRFKDAMICEKYPEKVVEFLIWLAESLTPGEFSNRIYAQVSKHVMEKPEVSPKAKRKVLEILSSLGLS